jgi:tetratricopeptide (TPR) repeat protein
MGKRTLNFKQIITSSALFFIPFTLYLSTLCPTLYWRDAGEFQVVSYQLGIAHPAGSPLYALAAKIFTFLPVGSIAFKVNLVSAFFGAFLIFVTFLLITECLKKFFSPKSNNISLLSGAIAVCFFTVSHALWNTAVQAEVYTLQNCFIVLIAFFLLRGLRTNEKSLLYLSAFLFGLSAGAHIIMILYIPALLLFLWLFYRKFLSPSQAGLIIMFVILGASIYLYLPVRSSVNPYYDWGNPENIKNFIVHVTDRKDASVHFAFSPGKFYQNLRKYCSYHIDEFSMLGVLLGLLGLTIFFKKNRALMLGFALFFFSQWFFFIRYWTTSTQFIPTFIFFTLAIAVGIYAVLQKIKFFTSQKNYNFGRYAFFLPGIIIGVLSAHLAILGYVHFKNNNRSAYWTPFYFHKYILDQIEFKGVLLSSLYHFGNGYLQQCEHYRSDITDLFLSEILSPDVFNTVTPKRYPLIQIPQAEGPKVGEAIINTNINTHAFYWEPGAFNDVVKQNIQPESFLFSITPTPQPLSHEKINSHLNKMSTFFNTTSLGFAKISDQEEIFYYDLILINYSKFFLDNKEYPLALSYLKMANHLDPDNATVLNGIGSVYATIGNFIMAERYFKKALNIEPAGTMIHQNLGQLYFDNKKYHPAIFYFQKLLKEKPNTPQVLLNIGICYKKTKKMEEARKSFQKVIVLNPESTLAQQAKNLLATVGDK